LPDRWFPRSDLAAESFAFDVLFGAREEDSFPRKIGADAWFDRWEAERYDVHEQTIRISDEEILTLCASMTRRCCGDRPDRPELPILTWRRHSRDGGERLPVWVAGDRGTTRQPLPRIGWSRPG
jgi:hypothetical protein